MSSRCSASIPNMPPRPSALPFNVRPVLIGQVANKIALYSRRFPFSQRNPWRSVYGPLPQRAAAHAFQRALRAPGKISSKIAPDHQRRPKDEKQPAELELPGCCHALFCRENSFQLFNI
jgi:hypothetical protein